VSASAASASVAAGVVEASEELAESSEELPHPANRPTAIAEAISKLSTFFFM
jgi:hypothetical protein